MAIMKTLFVVTLSLLGCSVEASSHHALYKFNRGQLPSLQLLANVSEVDPGYLQIDGLAKRACSGTQCPDDCYKGSNDLCCEGGGACSSDQLCCRESDGHYCAEVDEICCEDHGTCGPDAPVCCKNSTHCTVVGGVCCPDGSCGPNQTCGVCGTTPICCSDDSCTEQVFNDGTTSALTANQCSSIAPLDKAATIATAGTVAPGAAASSSSSSQSPTTIPHTSTSSSQASRSSSSAKGSSSSTSSTSSTAPQSESKSAAATTASSTAAETSHPGSNTPDTVAPSPPGSASSAQASGPAETHITVITATQGGVPVTSSETVVVQPNNPDQNTPAETHVTVVTATQGGVLVTTSQTVIVQPNNPQNPGAGVHTSTLFVAPSSSNTLPAVQSADGPRRFGGGKLYMSTGGSLLIVGLLLLFA